MRNARVLSALLRNEATRVERIDAPDDVASLQDRLVNELRAYADVVDDGLELVRDGVWRDQARFARERDAFEERSQKHAHAIEATIREFRREGYVIAIRPED